MKAVMYHYVREFSTDYPYFKFLDISDFRQQLEFFGNEYGFLTKEDFFESIESGHPKDGVILTFDDGLRDHYEFVFPELLKQDLWGIFYIPTLPYSHKKMLFVHYVHLLLGANDAKIVWNYLERILNDAMFSHYGVSEFHSLTYQNQSMEEYGKSVKRLLNYFLSDTLRDETIEMLMQHFFKGNLVQLNDYYMSELQINALEENGMLIGSHTVTHPVMSKLPIDLQEYEIKESFLQLDRLLNNPIGCRTFCYPYGGFHTFSDETISLLDVYNCRFSFNVEPRDIQVSDLLHNPQALPRYDCNAFPFGACKALGDYQSCLL